MKNLTEAQWKAFSEILTLLGVKPQTNVIHAGDPTKPTGLMIRVSMNEKFGVPFAIPEPPKFKRGKKE